MSKFWGKKRAEKITKIINETKTEERSYRATNTCISVAAFAGGVVQVHVDCPDPNMTFDLWKKVREELKNDVKTGSS